MIIIQQLFHLFIQNFGLILIFLAPFLHIFHLRGPFLVPISSILRKFSRLEMFFMKLMFFLLKKDFFYRNSLLRFIPEYISFIAANGVRPSVFTLQELKNALNSIYLSDEFRNGNPAFLIRPCPCRDALAEYSKTLPNVTDVIFTNNKKEYDTNKHNKFITKTNLFKKLEHFDKLGLVHMTLGCFGVDGTGINICNCHKSVCFVLQAVLVRGIKRGLNKGPSIAKIDPEKCKGIDECGICLGRCIFHARDFIDGKGHIIEENCYGCGLCANSCPAEATIMIERKHWNESFFPKGIISSQFLKKKLRK